MKTLIGKTLVLLAGICTFICIAGCETVIEDPFGGTASVAIKVMETSESSVEVTFTPSEECVSFRYYFGETDDINAFDGNTLPGIVTVDSGDEQKIEFKDLETGKEYYIFAVATDSFSNENGIASTNITLSEDKTSVEVQYVLDRSAGITINMTDDYRGAIYHLGKAEDRAAFESGELIDGTITDMDTCTVNYFELEPDTEYIFFSQTIDRSGTYKSITETPIKTYQDGKCPAVTFEYTNDIFTGEYTLTQNSLCDHISAFVCGAGTNDIMINSGVHWSGNIIKMMTVWEGINDATVSDGNNPLTLKFNTPSLLLDYELEIYVKIYGKDGNAAGIRRFMAKTPSKNGNAGKPEVSIKVSDITTSGATYTYTKGKDCFAFLYESVDADWFDDFKANDPNYHEYYLHETFLKNGGWAYGQDEVIYVEKLATPGMRLYAAACPMNENGPSEGWGDAVLIEYTTLTE